MDLEVDSGITLAKGVAIISPIGFSNEVREGPPYSFIFTVDECGRSWVVAKPGIAFHASLHNERLRQLLRGEFPRTTLRRGEGQSMNRREFIGAAAALTAATAHGWEASLPRRPYKNGIDLSVIAMGGIVVCGLSQEVASRRVAQAYDRGVNYFDCAPSYFKGEAESKLGEALRPYRSKVFLAEKTMHRDAKGAREELERTLQRFHTDHVDLYQFHAVSSMDDVDKILAPGGAAEMFFAARKEGMVRHLGFSAHNAPAALRLMDALELDSVLFPVNVNAWENGGFGPQILAKAKSKGMARMALKALAFGKWPANMKESDRKYPKCWYQPIDDREMARLALRFTLNEEVTAAVPPGDERIFDLALELASAPLPQLSASELTGLKTRISSLEPVFRV
jgi:predicted aldo/keto reductase-like oxidoreductase